MPHCAGTGDPESDCLLPCEGKPGCPEVRGVLRRASKGGRGAPWVVGRNCIRIVDIFRGPFFFSSCVFVQMPPRLGVRLHGCLEKRIGFFFRLPPRLGVKSRVALEELFLLVRKYGMSVGKCVGLCLSRVCSVAK